MVVVSGVTWPITSIADDETLCRRVPEDRLGHDNQGHVRLSARVFRDRYCRPSVYRASLLESVEQVQETSTDGVLALAARAIRGMHPIPRNDAKGNRIQEYSIDVEHKPDGPAPTLAYAHSEVFLRPDMPHEKTCGRMYEALAILAQDQWIILPKELRRGA